MSKYKCLLLILAAMMITGTIVQAAEWVDLFDGKTLDGWIQRNGEAKYTVEDGCIVGTTVLNTPNSFLCTEKNYSDFILDIEFLVEPTMNSGIQIRSNSLSDYKNGRVHGYQVEIDPSARAWSGGIYDEGRRGWLFDLKGKPKAQKAFKQNQWNHYRVEAIGDRIRTWVNGVPAADLKDNMTATGFIALQVHASKTAGQQIKWRNIKLMDLSKRPGKGNMLKALIVDGQNNHNWQEVTPELKSILEETGIFTVDVATSPAKGQPMDNFKPQFAKYDVVVSNYTGDYWPKETQDALVDYMKNGGGLVVVHAADNAFARWKEWNEMIGLGGWEGRNEKSGPYVYMVDGKVVRDNSPGSGGAHGQQVDYVVTTREKDHPIMRGLPEKWLHVKDELYSRLRGPAKNMTILATARQDRSTGGTGRDEPVLMTIRYGKGRVFHTVLGHAAEQTKCVGFIVTTQRGTEWAATGNVTLTDIPADFPTEDKVSLRTASVKDFAAIEEYDFGKSRAALAAIEEQMKNIPVSAYGPYEDALIKVLKSSKTTYAGKQFACRMLRRIGSEKCVPVLADMLTDKELSHMSRFALQYLPADSAGKVLTDAISKVDGDLKIGMISSLGMRQERSAVSSISGYISDRDKDIARTAIIALGRIGGKEAASALAHARVDKTLQDTLDDSYLLCADSLAAEGDTAEAVTIYNKMTSARKNKWIRIAAYKGLVNTLKDKAIPEVISLLKDSDADIRNAAGKFIVEMPGSRATVEFARQLSSLEPAGQSILLSALESRADKAAAPFIEKVVLNSDESVQVAAIKALAVLGNADSVTLLAKSATKGGKVAKAAEESLSRISADGVSEQMISIIVSPQDSAARIAVIEAVINRDQQEALDALLKAADDRDADVRKTACKALGSLAGPDQVGAMVSLLVKTESSSDRGSLERAMVSMVPRLSSSDSRSLIAALPKADTPATESLLNVLARIGGADALKAVRTQINSSDPDKKKAAIRALADWKSPEPLEDLIAIAKSDSSNTNRILAVRGYVKLLGMPANRTSAKTVALLEDVLKVASRTEEKRLILATLSKYPCKEGMALAEKMSSDPDLASEAKKAISIIKGLLANRKLTATASHNSGNAKNAFDGDQSTRWDTGTTKKPGFWFTVDLGIEAQVAGIILDTNKSARDYPEGYEIYTSFDGGNWAGPVVSGKEGKPYMEIKFPEPVTTRFIKIVQLGSSNSWYWSIHEMKILYAD